MFNNKTIEKRVMEVVRKRISDAQMEYNAGKKEITLAATDRCNQIMDQATRDKEELADRLVNQVLGSLTQ